MKQKEKSSVPLKNPKGDRRIFLERNKRKQNLQNRQQTLASLFF
jgi:hypothetical protein